jgi:hypothetical protein
MTPKEKAKELYNKFCEFTPVEFEQEYTKKCALIAVDEILKQYTELSPSHLVTAYKTVEDFNSNVLHVKRELDYYRLRNVLYFEEVKQEIEKL